MLFMWMMVAGLIATACAKLLLPAHSAGRLFILGISGSIIAGLLQYSRSQPIGFVAPLAGAVILLATYAVTVRRHVIEDVDQDRDDFRKAA
jgi:uncharacterized membrane protein YeaQ/YmgE (transglycosylase-associated protein family)